MIAAKTIAYEQNGWEYQHGSLHTTPLRLTPRFAVRLIFVFNRPIGFTGLLLPYWSRMNGEHEFYEVTTFSK